MMQWCNIEGRNVRWFNDGGMRSGGKERSPIECQFVSPCEPRKETPFASENHHADS